jgi:hypothetical protein
MTGLLNLISKHLSELIILPILAGIIIVLTIVLYLYFKEKKIVKYLPSLITGVVALLIGIYSIGIFTSEKGLDTAWIAVFLGTSALAGLLVSFIIDLVNSIKTNYQQIEKANNGKK